MISSEEGLDQLKRWKENSLLLLGQFKTSSNKVVDLRLVSVADVRPDEVVLNFRESASAPWETITVEQLLSASFSDGKDENDPQFAKTFSTSAIVIFLKDGSNLVLVEPPVDFSLMLGDGENFEL